MLVVTECIILSSLPLDLILVAGCRVVGLRRGCRVRCLTILDVRARVAAAMCCRGCVGVVSGLCRGCVGVVGVVG